jgi:hypothetical protein
LKYFTALFQEMCIHVNRPGVTVIYVYVYEYVCVYIYVCVCVCKHICRVHPRTGHEGPEAQ